MIYSRDIPFWSDTLDMCLEFKLDLVYYENCFFETFFLSHLIVLFSFITVVGIRF